VLMGSISAIHYTVGTLERTEDQAGHVGIPTCVLYQYSRISCILTCTSRPLRDHIDRQAEGRVRTASDQ
jgi:hypothetical protein